MDQISQNLYFQIIRVSQNTLDIHSDKKRSIHNIFVSKYFIEVLSKLNYNIEM